MLFLCAACSGRREKLADAVLERDSLPLMRTTGVDALISDSGVLRYRLVTAEYAIFDKKTPPYWAFERGVYLEQFDSLHQVQATIQADTAYYYDRKKLWELRGHVFIQNQQGEEFRTEQLFWNQATERVYSDRHIRIRQTDNIIEGYGFDSDQRLTQYTIRDTEGIFPIDEAPADTLSAQPTANTPAT